MWELPGPGIEPMSPAPAGGFLTTAPPGKVLRSLSEGTLSTHKNLLFAILRDAVSLPQVQVYKSHPFVCLRGSKLLTRIQNKRQKECHSRANTLDAGKPSSVLSGCKPLQGRALALVDQQCPPIAGPVCAPSAQAMTALG